MFYAYLQDQDGSEEQAFVVEQALVIPNVAPNGKEVMAMEQVESTKVFNDKLPCFALYKPKASSSQAFKKAVFAGLTRQEAARMFRDDRDCWQDMYEKFLENHDLFICRSPLVKKQLKGIKIPPFIERTLLWHSSSGTPFQDADNLPHHVLPTFPMHVDDIDCKCSAIVRIQGRDDIEISIKRIRKAADIAKLILAVDEVCSSTDAPSEFRNYTDEMRQQVMARLKVHHISDLFTPLGEERRQEAWAAGPGAVTLFLSTKDSTYEAIQHTGDERKRTISWVRTAPVPLLPGGHDADAAGAGDVAHAAAPVAVAAAAAGNGNHQMGDDLQAPHPAGGNAGGLGVAPPAAPPAAAPAAPPAAAPGAGLDIIDLVSDDEVIVIDNSSSSDEEGGAKAPVKAPAAKRRTAAATAGRLVGGRAPKHPVTPAAGRAPKRAAAAAAGPAPKRRAAAATAGPAPKRSAGPAARAPVNKVQRKRSAGQAAPAAAAAGAENDSDARDAAEALLMMLAD